MMKLGTWLICGFDHKPKTFFADWIRRLMNRLTTCVVTEHAQGELAKRRKKFDSKNLKACIKT